MLIKKLFNGLRSLTSMMFYILLLTLIFSLINTTLDLFGTNRNRFLSQANSYNTYEVISLDAKYTEPLTYFSKDNVLKYQNIKNRYILSISPGTTANKYATLSHQIFLLFGVTIFWYIRKILIQTKLHDPFKKQLIQQLKILALLFIAYDVLKLTDYKLLSHFIQQSIISPQLKVITTIGNGFIIGTVIWVTTIIFKRGIELQEENALTV